MRASTATTQSDEQSLTIIRNAKRLIGDRSKSDLARRSDIERTKLYRFLNGRQMLRADELQRLARTLNVEVTAFYGLPARSPDFQSAFMKNDDFALRISGVLLGAVEKHPVKDVSALSVVLADVTPEPEAQRIVADLCEVLRSPALSSLAFIGAWALLWDQMAVDEGIQMARSARRVIPNYEDLMIRAGSVYFRCDQDKIDGMTRVLEGVEPEALYLKAIDRLAHVLSLEHIDHCASLAHKVLEKNRRRTQEDVHRRLIALKRAIDADGAPVFWAKLLTFLDPNIP